MFRIFLILLLSLSVKAQNYVAKDFAKEVVNPKKFVFLKLPNVGKPKVWSLYTAAEMITQYYGHTVKAELLDGMTTSKTGRSSDYELSKTVSYFAYDWRYTHFSSFKSGVKLIERDLDQARPLLFFTNKLESKSRGHEGYAIVGYDNKYFFCTLPGANKGFWPGGFIIEKKDLIKSLKWGSDYRLLRTSKNRYIKEKNADKPLEVVDLKAVYKLHKKRIDFIMKGKSQCSYEKLLCIKTILNKDESRSVDEEELITKRLQDALKGELSNNRTALIVTNDALIRQVGKDTKGRYVLEIYEPRRNKLSQETLRIRTYASRIISKDYSDKKRLTLISL